MNRLAFASFRVRDFRNFWLASFASQLGFQMQVVAINWHTYEITHSALSLGFIGLLSFLPILLFSLPGGLLADMVSRKKLMITSQILLGFSAVFLVVATNMQIISPFLLYAGVVLYAIIITIDLPSRQSVIPTLVPKEYFVNAVGLATLARQIAIVVGPVIAGFVIEFFGVGSVYMLNVCFFAVSGSILLFLAIPNVHIKNAVTPTFSSIMEGIHFVRKSPIISSTMLLDFFANFFSAATVLLPIFAKDILGTGAKGLGLLYAAPSIGAITAGILISSMGHIKHQGRLLVIGVLIYGVATIGFGLSTSFFLSLFFLFWIGAGDMMSTIVRNTVRQVLTPDHLRGRMVSINMIFFAGGPQLGEAEAGFLAALIGAPLSVVFGGVGTLIATGCLIAFVPIVWKYTHKS